MEIVFGACPTIILINNRIDENSRNVIDAALLSKFDDIDDVYKSVLNHRSGKQNKNIWGVLLRKTNRFSDIFSVIIYNAKLLEINS